MCTVHLSGDAKFVSRSADIIAITEKCSWFHPVFFIGVVFDLKLLVVKDSGWDSTMLRTDINHSIMDI